METPYQVPFDRTGFGPSGVGNNPTMAERLMSQNDKFHTSRVIDAMRFNDPYMRQAMEQQARILGATNDAAEVRRRAYGTAQGQAAQDILMAARVSGMMGKGDPRMYAQNIVRGVTAGGFGVDVMDGAGRTTGFGQRVSGNGVVAERLAMNYAQNMTRDLYGEGTPDPSKLHGFNMTEASEIFAGIARDSGLGGRAMAVQHNANLATRLDAARDAAVDPLLKSGLAGIGKLDMEKLSTAEDAYRRGDNTKLDEYLKTVNDPNLKKEIAGIVKSTDAFIVNDEARKQTSATVKEVIKGLSTIKDMYGELSNPQLKAKMEELTGVRVTDIASSKRSTALMDKMRGAAEANGYDPRAYVELLSARTAGLGGRIGAAMGLDERGGAASESLAGMFRAEIGANAARAARMAAESESRGKELGFDMAGSANSVEYYMADQEQGQADYVAKNKATILMRGSLSMMDPKTRAEALALSKQISAATDPEEARLLESRASSLVADRLGNGSFAQAEARYMNPALKQLSLNKFGMGDVTNADLASGRQNAVLTSNTTRKLSEAGMTGADAKSISRSITQNLGSGGMLDIESVARNKTASLEARTARIMQIMTGDAGMSLSDAEIYRKNMFNADLTSKVGAGVVGSIGADLNSGGGEQSTKRGIKKAARDYLNRGSGLRNSLGGSNGELSISSIIGAIATGKSGEMSSDEGKTLLLQTMKDEGMTLKGADGEDLSGQVLGNLDISKGLTADALAKIRGVTKGDLGGTDAELIESTKSEEGRMALMKRLEGLEDISLSGDQNSLNMVSRKLLDSGVTDKAAARAKEFGLAQQVLFPDMGKGEENRLTRSFKSGGKLDIGLQADKYEKRGAWGNFWGSGGDKVSLSNEATAEHAVSAISGMSPEQLATLSAGDSGKQTLEFLTRQRDTLQSIKEDGRLITKEDGTTESVSDARIKSFEDAIAKLQGAMEAKAETVGIMKVETLEVTGTYKPAS